MTTLIQSPFYLLGATTRDNRRRIVELAEEKSLMLDGDVCTKARSDLTSPRNRLAVEMAWLPGLSRNSERVLVDSMYNLIDLVKMATTAPALAKANLLAAAIDFLDPEIDADLWCDRIVEFAYTVDMIEPEDVLLEINEDRSVSGFPEVKLEHIEAELRERQRYYTDTIKTALDGLESMKLVEVVTAVVAQTTESGEDHAPQLVHELVDRYASEANRYLQPEAENIKKLIVAIREAAAESEAAAKPLVDRLDRMARKWDSIAQPIQLSMKAQGLDHNLSHDVAWGMRSLAVDLFNKHDMLDIATRLNQTLQELFAELPAVVERLNRDSEALGDISRKREQESLLNSTPQNPNPHHGRSFTVEEMEEHQKPISNQAAWSKAKGFVVHVSRNWVLYGFGTLAAVMLLSGANDRPSTPPHGPKPYQANPALVRQEQEQRMSYEEFNALYAPKKAVEDNTAKPTIKENKAYVRPSTAENGQPWPASASYVKGYPRLHADGLSTVTVDNGRNDSDVFVKLVSLNSAQAYPVRQFYIPAFGSFILNKVTAGSYDIRYRDLSNGGLSRSDKFSLEETAAYNGTQYSNITMTLYKVKNGNMQTYGLSEAEF